MRIKNRNLLKLFFALLVLLVWILIVHSVMAEEYYADITIDVDDSGFVTIDGITNHPDLLVENTEIYTYKKQSYWLLNITKEQIFSDYIFHLILPQDSSINFIKSSGSIRIEEDRGNLVVRGFGENESFFIIVQYQVIKSLDNEGVISNNTLFLIGTLLLIISLFLIIMVISINKKIHFKSIEKQKKDNQHYNLRGLTNRQKDIMDLLIERNRPLTQTEIQQELNIPKAAISRNIHSLEIKGLVEIEKIGMSNLIKVKKNDF